MKTTITACLVALVLGACAITPPNEQRNADNLVPPGRIYIQEMTKQVAGLAEVQFSREAMFFNDSWPLELALNDVVLAQILPGEHLSIWLKPGNSYTFSVKPVHGLTSPAYEPGRAVTLDLNSASQYKLHISTGTKGLILQSEQ